MFALLSQHVLDHSIRKKKSLTCYLMHQTCLLLNAHGNPESHQRHFRLADPCFFYKFVARQWWLIAVKCLPSDLFTILKIISVFIILINIHILDLWKMMCTFLLQFRGFLHPSSKISIFNVFVNVEEIHYIYKT